MTQNTPLAPTAGGGIGFYQSRKEMKKNDKEEIYARLNLYKGEHHFCHWHKRKKTVTITMSLKRNKIL